MASSHLFRPQIGKGKTTSVYYHDIFNYPLTYEELLKWEVGRKVKVPKKVGGLKHKNGCYFCDGREENIRKRQLREKFSKGKFIIAKKAGRVLEKIPTVQMVGITGSLAMKNADKDSDIDLMIITANGTLWTTRFLAYLILLFLGFKLRRASDEIEKDKLCLNMWLDRSDLVWQKRNIFTAHEIAQVVPLVNKDEAYERFLWKNRWTLDFWPNAVSVKKERSSSIQLRKNYLLESLLYKLQFLYMRRKITNEVITPTRAVFHPINLSLKVTRLFREFEL